MLGLGNPGPRYARSRHNVGFTVVENLAARWYIVLESDRSGVRSGEGVIAGVQARLAQPQLYMNRSGEALAELDGPWTVDDLIVVHDDIDLPAGRLRVRQNGGSGGHRGLASVADRWGNSFHRVRIGVGRPPAGVDPADYVLLPLTALERHVLRTAVERASDAVECLIAAGIEEAMNRFNGPITDQTCDTQGAK